ncbi:toll-like receptor 13 isoform X1 [Siniperca chuatsi]|uniref:toll-like receptor 13 isoform X1 n=1 Tax=Siniperca chuatsi TaxID=119488 RepID=UPI001CE04EF3|nr:toll-like receptor 13 isoform X1 [Siniperca chuatsi]XP_044039803.1 toll-like receptor 13 isoform X1 [Siniperca chuatsi]XP_044039805.1 toll-like receptor 13 isoform X1 [Siniperca chuatsi]XP_044039806.1 toll-like receptor 13 isoform X1 [Siniperca chuatsi]
MQAIRSWPLLLVCLLSCLLRHNPLLAFSLKNCTIAYSENANNQWVICKERDLTAIPDDIPRNATSLDLSLNQLLKITRTDLRCLSKLTAAQVQYNLISHIDDGAFADLVELRTLIMDQNKLTNLTDDMFQGLSKLVMLSLYNNRISYISPAAFQSLVGIRTVILGANLLHQISDIAPILKLPTLHDLFLGYNKFTSFQSDDLHVNVSNLKLLRLGMNPLRKFSITKDIFPYLQSLDLSECSCDIEWDVANKTFLRSLTILSFSGTYISFEAYRAMLRTADSLQKLVLYVMKERIEEGLIDIACRIPSLRTLDVSICKIGTIDDNLLRSCSQLTELTFSGSDLSELSEHSLRSMTQLRLLTLNGNHLSKPPLALRGLSILEILDLSSNYISELDCLDFLDLTRLTNLNLNHNRISKLQGCVFQNLNNLKVLDVGENAFFTFENTFKVNLRKLESLILHNNGLLELTQGDFRNLSSLSLLDLESDTYYNVFDGAFEGLTNLQTLSLSLDNYRKELFRGLPQLENLTLHLTFNWNQRSSQQNDEPPFSNLPNLKKLVFKVYDAYSVDVSPDLLKGLKSLECLMADQFFMKSLHPDTFKYTPRLKSLQIIHSDLSDLTPELFWPIPNLQALDLSNNKFSSLDFLARAKLLALSWLKLSENTLSVINETVFQSLPALTYLDLTDNPLTCTCSNSGFNQWVQSNNQTQVVNGHQYTCAFPVNQQGNKFLDFDIHSCWIDASFLCFISSTCLIVLTLLASFIYHFLRWHLAYAYYLFLAFLYDKKRRKKGTPHHYDAFVSYNIHDEAWVYREMLPVLEGEQGWRLCLHHRDFEPGKPIVENITEAIYGSRKTICVISRHYLQSEWCSREIQMASFRLFDEQEDVLILLFMEEIPAQQLSLYYRMRSVVKRRTYLSWPQAGQHTGVFWQNVSRALDTAERPTEHAHHLTRHPSFIQ